MMLTARSAAVTGLVSVSDIQPAFAVTIDSMETKAHRSDDAATAIAAAGFELVRVNRASVISAPGDPNAFFTENPLRILTCARLSAKQALPVEERTLESACSTAAGLRSCDIAAVFNEIGSMLLGAGAGAAIMAFSEALAQVIPAIGAMAGCPQNTPYHIYDVLEHTARVVDGSPATPTSRWAALLHDSGKPQCRRTDCNGRDHFKGYARAGADIARETLTRLNAPADLTADVCRLIRLHEWFVLNTDEDIQAALLELDGRVDLYRALLALQVADSSAKAPDATERRDHALKLQARLESLVAQG